MPDLLVCSGSMNQFTAIYSGSGELINHIKYYDGFMGQRVGAISCLAFHPHWVCVSPRPGHGGGGTGRWGHSQAPPHTTGGRLASPALCPRTARNKILSGPRVSKGRDPHTASKSSTRFPRQAGSRGVHRHETAPLFLSPLAPVLMPSLQKPCSEAGAGASSPSLCSLGRGSPSLTVAHASVGSARGPRAARGCPPGCAALGPQTIPAGSCGEPPCPCGGVRGLCREPQQGGGEEAAWRRARHLPAHPPCSPLQPHLAVGSNDYFISVYSVEKRAR